MLSKIKNLNNIDGGKRNFNRPQNSVREILRDYTPSPHFFKRERGEDIVQSFWRQKAEVRMNSDRVKVA